MSETIAAISSGMTSSGIGIVRLSGDNAISVVDSIFVPKNKSLSESKSHTIHFGTIEKDGEIIDEVLVLLMRAPNTYTKEDVVEIDCHGGITVVRKIYETVLSCGVRPAEPGEFTKRAFLNGRIDLSQAESVMGVISSENDMALSASLSNLQGRLSNEIKDLREKIIYENAFIESALDDPEHISLDGYPEKLRIVVSEVKQRLKKLLSTFRDGELLREGIKTVIVGKPNAGKSSVWNTLIGKEKAIVTDIAGTTRDILEETINLQGLTLKLIDTAGIRDASDKIEQIGIEKSISSINDADLILYVVDSSVELDENDKLIIDKLQDKPVVIIYNKTDLSSVISKTDILSCLNKPIITFSSVDEIGLNELKSEIINMFFDGKLSFNEEVIISNIRQKNEVELAKNSICHVIDSIDNGMPEDFFSIDLIDAYVHLGYIIGESIEDDLVDKIFREFCTGK